MQNIVEARIPMLENGLLKTREQAEELARVQLDIHLQQLKNQIGDERYTEYREGPIEENGVFIFRCLLEWRK